MWVDESLCSHMAGGAADTAKRWSAQAMGKELPIWRLAFFSRLEERKGIKLFVDAVSQIKAPDMDKFEVRLSKPSFNSMWGSSAAPLLVLSFLGVCGPCGDLNDQLDYV